MRSAVEVGKGGSPMNSNVSCAGGCEARGRVDGCRFNKAESGGRGRREAGGGRGILFFLVETELRFTNEKGHRDREEIGSGTCGAQDRPRQPGAGDLAEGEWRVPRQKIVESTRLSMESSPFFNQLGPTR